MRKGILFLPLFVILSLTLSATTADAGIFLLSLKDETSGAFANIETDDPSIVFADTVGAFDVLIFGDIFTPPTVDSPIQMNLSNWVVSYNGAPGSTGGSFTATLTRKDVDTSIFSGPKVVGVANYGTEIPNTTNASINFQSWIDTTNTGTTAGATPVFPVPHYASTSGESGEFTSAEVDVTGLSDVAIVSSLVFNFTGTSGSATANTDLALKNASPVSEPTTLFLFGPGVLALTALRRRLHSKAL